MKIVATLMLGTALAGCNVQAKHHNDNDSDDNVTISGGDNGKVSFDLPFMKGQVKLPEGTTHSSNFDIDGVKMYPSATIHSFHVEAHNENSVVNMAFNAPAPPEKVSAYFLDQFKAKGVEASASGNTVTGKSKDGSPFTITVTPNGGGSQGTIEIHDKD